MLIDLGVVFFERYLSARGYTIEARDEDYGTGKRPDYRLRAGGRDVVVELKTFGPLGPVAPSRPGGFVGSQVGAVRDRIHAAARQLRGIDGLPVVAALASPLDGLKPLHPAGVIEAMYGDLGVHFDEGPEINFGSGRNGRLRVEEGGAGSHPYLSAVAVVRCSDAARWAMRVWMAGNVCRFQTDQAAFAAGLDEIAAAGSGVELVELDVFEAVSTTAVPLPREVFDGPGDTRWGKIGPGRYGRLAAPAA